ncbi:hypothetical protein HK097_011453 [Rhizophlyctis rosea]|uniref:F-box domain-containing protein n=1 Tax=Rhizophlyctis rosea TaxID=64517 RepID=A0AAD5S691_9FUNG|nr:hypothetical protein HK097_011453 [Rhizophlyctis rosea]
MDAASRLCLVPHILELIFSHTNVPTLLRCEQTTRQFNLLLRTGSTTQIWKTKLERNFPSGCLPLLYGHENWRDLACSWYAWSTPWRPKEVDVEYEDCWQEEDLKEGDYFDQQEDGVVRDLVDLVGNWTYPAETMLAFADGTVIDQVRNLGAPDRGDSRFIRLFNNPAPNPAFFPHMNYAEYVRPTNIIIQYAKTTTQLMVTDINTGKSLYESKGGLCPSFMRVQGNICTLFSFISTFYGTRLPTQLIDARSKATFEITQPEDPTALPDHRVVFNETLATIAHPHQNLTGQTNIPQWTITVHRIHPQSLIAKHTLPPDIALVDLCMTRFNLLTIEHSDDEFDSRKISVRSLTTLETLYTLPIPDTDQSPKILTSNTAVLYGRHMGGRYMLDPIKRQKIRMTVPVMEHVDEIEPDNVCQKMGYAFVIREFDCDGAGKRCGGLGRDRVFWQWEGSWVDVQLRD